MSSPSLVALLLLAADHVLAQGYVSLAPSTSASDVSDLSQIISPSFAGMGIEPSNLYSFTGGAEGPNMLSINLFTNLANYTGVPPHLRIGGNTEDNMIYLSSWSDYSIYYNPDPVGQGAVPSDQIFFGPTYFECLDRFPANTPITYGLNLAYDNADYLTRIVEEASAAVTMLKNVDLVSFEIGNEPDLYLANGFRNGSWTHYEYADQWAVRAQAVFDQALAPNGRSANFFEPGCTASTIGTTFQIEQLDDTVITAVVNGTSNETFAVGWNQHDYFYYIGVTGYTLYLDFLMQLSNTPSQMASWAEQKGEAGATNKPYYLREMASVGPIGQTGISDVFGATIWTLNFFLYTASINISSVQMHMTDDSFAAPWQPIPNYNVGPYVRTTYYAWAAFDQLIGGGCTTRVAPITITAFPEGYGDRLTAYASYRGDALTSLVLFNTLMSNASVIDKGSVSFNFSLPAFAGQTVYLSYLTNEGADSRFNTTWNGISYEISGDGTPTTVDTTDYTLTIDSEGNVGVPVRDSQVVIANIGFKLGSDTLGSSAAAACQALASSIAEGAEALASGAYSYAASTATGSALPISATYTPPTVTSTSSSKGGAAAMQTTPPLMMGAVAMGALLGGMVAYA